MTAVKGIVVCVDYDDLFRITLPRNARHLTEVLVVTSPADDRTKAVAAGVPSARVFETDAFYRHGARFNKSLALEEGFDVLGRDGWIAIWDADVLFPDRLPSLRNLDPEVLYGAPRRVLADPTAWAPDLDWTGLPFCSDLSFPGYFQLFHAGARAIADRPWYDVTFTHAGGGDGYFEDRWPRARKVKLPCHVLHLGPPDTNWFGRVSARADGAEVPQAAARHQDMEQFLRAKGWTGHAPAGPVDERICLPGLPGVGDRVG